VLAVLLSAVLLAAAAGCGRKLPPEPPGTKAPAAVRDLAASLEGSRATLTWSHSAAEGGAAAPAVEYRVFRARIDPADGGCATCPAPFKLIGELSARRHAVGSRLRFRDELEPGYRYRYKVVALSGDGTAAGDGNVVEVGR
jgi:hypothetical protein